MSKHTPGPWHVKPSSCDDRISTIEADLVTVATVETTPEDARLIAAAPAMLVALKRVAGDADDMRNVSFSAVQTCRAAISQAEGRDD